MYWTVEYFKLNWPYFNQSYKENETPKKKKKAVVSEMKATHKPENSGHIHICRHSHIHAWALWFKLMSMGWWHSQGGFGLWSTYIPVG